jgi:hypothetical protein
MNNEPVAWMRTNKQWRKEVSWVEKEGFNIPLYTHPADESFDRTASHMAGEYVSYPAKTLTDEEILEVAKEMGWRGALGFLINFARAILRKALEK